MRRLPLSLLMLIVCASCATCAVPVSGRVLDANTHKPISGAHIGVYESGQGTVTTDKQGRFKLSTAPGDRQIVYYDGGNPQYRSDDGTYTLVNVPKQGLAGVTLCLLKVEFARGKAFGPTGMPLIGAAVTVGGAAFTHAVTDSKGLFKVEVPKGQLRPSG